MVGIEIDRQRVLDAQPFADDRTRFVEGGFEVPLPSDVGSPRLIRAMNVLRQYPEEAVHSAWEQMGHRLIPGGLLVEGTSDPTGRLLAANLLRRHDHGLEHEGVLLSVRLNKPFQPTDLQPILPKNLIHRLVDDHPAAEFFASWTRAWRQSSSLRPFGPPQVFVAAAQTMYRETGAIKRPDRWTHRGYILWRLAPGGSH